MANEKVYGVLLTDHAWTELGGALEAYTSAGPIGKYIYCHRVDHAGNIFVLVATCKNPDGSEFEAEIVLPSHYLKLCIAAPKSQIGFIHGEPCERSGT